MSDQSNNTKQSSGFRPSLWGAATICVVILTGVMGARLYASSEEETCRKFATEARKTSEDVREHQWSWSEGCKIEVIVDEETAATFEALEKRKGK